MQWLDLAFIHFEADAGALRQSLPPGVELDLHDGRAWVGIVPFRIAALTKRGWPAPSLLCDFPEINVRTYVTAGGKRGVWFLSLNAPNVLAAWTARTFFHAPFFPARVSLSETGAGLGFSAQRDGREFTASYGSAEPATTRPGSFAGWATERYCLYSYDAATRRLFRTEVQHPKWPLRRARMEIHSNTLADIPLGPMHPEVQFSRRLDVVMWNLERVS